MIPSKVKSGNSTVFLVSATNVFQSKYVYGYRRASCLVAIILFFELAQVLSNREESLILPRYSCAGR